MPPGFASARTARQLSADPIETDSDTIDEKPIRAPQIQRLGRAWTHGSKQNYDTPGPAEQQHLPHFADASAEEIPRPYTDPNNHRYNMLRGPNRNVNTLNGERASVPHADFRKRPRQLLEGTADSSTGKRQITLESTDDEVATSPPTETKRKQRIIGGRSQPCDSKRPSQTHKRSGSGSSSMGNGGRKPRGLLSSKKPKHWRITTFQKGTLQADSDPDSGQHLHLEWEEKRGTRTGHFRINMVDELTKDSQEVADFSADFVKLYHCGNQIGLEFRGATPCNGYLTIANRKEIEEVKAALTNELNQRRVHEVDEDRMRKHCEKIKVQNKRSRNILVDDPEDSERLREIEHKSGIVGSASEPRGIVKSSEPARPKLLREDKDHELAKTPQEKSPSDRRMTTRSTGGTIRFASLTPTKRTTRSDKPSNEGMRMAKKRRPEIAEDPVLTHERQKPLQLPEPPWTKPLIYPSTGLGRTPVEYEDLHRLGPGEWLNDNIINFYMKYLEVNLREKNPRLSEQTHFMNTFFFERLCQKGKSGISKEKNLDGILKWTAKLDLFKKNYIIIPINESSHWYLAIVCNLHYLERRLGGDTVARDTDGASTDGTRADASDDRSSCASDTQHDPESMSVDNEWPSEDDVERLDGKKEASNHHARLPYGATAVDSLFNHAAGNGAKTERKATQPVPPNTPVIIILDSMNVARRGAIIKIKEWLIHEAKVKRGLEVTKTDLRGWSAKNPEQDNGHDCGVHALHYIEVFLDHVDTFVESFLARDLTPDNEMWGVEGIATMRERIFDLVCTLYGAQETEAQERKVDGRPIPALPPSRAPSSPAASSTVSTNPSNDDHTVFSLGNGDSPGEQLANEANMNDVESAASAAERVSEPEVVRIAKKARK